MPRLRFHHVGIPTDRPLPEDDHIAEFKIYASGYEQSPYGIEWMKFEKAEIWPRKAKFRME
ncbi:MAG: hypothetical protein MUQ25_14230 [Candidatus Aminicenantes bacterium]|nr:hypothetical protein [Candidatus Aminicenantes bacterium]